MLKSWKSFWHFLNSIVHVVLNKVTVSGELEEVWKEMWLKDCLYCSTQQEEGHVVNFYTVTETANPCHLSGLHSWKLT